MAMSVEHRAERRQWNRSKSIEISKPEFGTLKNFEHSKRMKFHKLLDNLNSFSINLNEWTRALKL